MKPIPISVTAGWYVEKNDIFPLEPSCWADSDLFKDRDFCAVFDDELFVAVHIPSAYLLEAGWQKWNDPASCFYIRLLKPEKTPARRDILFQGAEYDWKSPFKFLETRSTAELSKILGDLMEEVTMQY